MFSEKKFTFKKYLILPWAFILTATFACAFEVGILDPTPTPHNQAANKPPDHGLAGTDPDEQESAQPTPTNAVVDCQESPFAGLVFRNRNPTDQLIQVGTCGENIPLSTQTDVEISPDGEKALFVQDDDIWVLDFLSGDMKNLTETLNRVEVNPQWWPGNEDLVVFGSWEAAADLGPTAGILSMISIDGGDYRILAEQPSNGNPAPRPGQSVIAYDLGGAARLYHLDKDESEIFDVNQYGLTINKGMKIGSPSWSPDGKKLTWWVGGEFSPPINGSIALAVFDLEGGSVDILHPYTPAGFGGWVPTPIWSPDGKWLAAVTLGEAHKADLWVIDPDRGEEHLLGFASGPVWNPGSNALVYQAWPDEDLKLIEIDGWKMQPLDLPPKSVPVDWLGTIHDISVVSQPSTASSDQIFGPEVLFATSPDPTKSQLVFPYGTPEIFAIWPYRNMQDGLTIHREWYLDGNIWIVREESWDYTKYGTDGIVTDISIYDYEDGLPPGKYQLRLFIDGQEQQLGTGEVFSAAFFEISDPVGISPQVSTDFTKMAIVDPPGTLIIQDVETQKQQTVLTVEEISSLTWYPDGRYILFSIRDRTSKQAMSTSSKYVDDLWVIDLETGESYPLTSQFGSVTASGLHHPSISPDGRYVAAIEGSGWTDACFVDHTLWIKEIGFSGDLMQEVYSYYQLDFAFDNFLENSEMHVKRIIGWDSATLLKVELGWTCTDENLDGIYMIDMESMTAEKIGESE